MSFQEKSNLVVLTAVVLVFGGYFAFVLPGVALAGATPPAAAVGATLIVLTILLVVILVAAHILIALLAPKEAGKEDERDRTIEMRADARAGYVLASGVFIALGMLFFAIPPFWVANALLGSMAASEIVKGALRAVAYRRNA